MENASTEIVVDPSSAAVISPPLPPPLLLLPLGLKDKLKADRPWLARVSAADFSASLSSNFLNIPIGGMTAFGQLGTT